MSKKPPILILSDSQIKELEKQYKQERDRRIAERIHCIILAIRGYDWEELKQILLVGVRTSRSGLGSIWHKE